MTDKQDEGINERDEEKILVSVYISTKTLERIDDFLFDAKKQLPIGKRRKLTKSIFYETSLQILLEDHKLNGVESPLWKAIAKLAQD